VPGNRCAEDLQPLVLGSGLPLVDLTNVCAFQPAIVNDQALSRVQTADKDDLVSIAAITLPLTQVDALPFQHNQIHQTRAVPSPNPNLRIADKVGPVSACSVIAPLPHHPEPGPPAWSTTPLFPEFPPHMRQGGVTTPAAGRRRTVSAIPGP
jgi:hypothetical protein